MDDYRLVLDERPTYLHATVTGARTPGNALRYFREVYEACLRTGLRDVLLEMAFTGPSLGAPGVFNVISQASPDGAKLGRIAYVEASPDGPGKAQFAETVARNRAVNVRLFPDVAAAARWLEEAP